jgi:hypothetical protein
MMQDWQALARALGGSLDPLDPPLDPPLYGMFYSNQFHMHVTVNNKLLTKFGLLYCNHLQRNGWQFIVNCYMHVELVGIEEY